MGTDERASAGTLIERLLERPQGFNLFQAISLLERASPHLAAVGMGNGEAEAVRLNSVVSLGFQPSDVSAIVKVDLDSPYVLRTPVLSLAGAQGPLPLPFTELLLERRAARDGAMGDFLDIFNQRLLAFLYRGRKKHHIGLNWDSRAPSAVATCLDYVSALGLKAGHRSPNGQSAWLRHAGLMGGAPRSMTGLVALLTDRLGLSVRGEQFKGQWQELEASDVSRLRGARSPRLGASAVLGRRAWHQGAGIRLELDSLPLTRLQGLLPGAEDHVLTNWLVNRYVQQEVQAELMLRPKPADIAASRLGSGGGMRLGWTAWLHGDKPIARGVQPIRLRLGRKKEMSWK